ncbi:nad(P)-binding protein [Stemphylium lycopersici]|uniref:Nad(P)-binding protein n=1 Tax=Stemphylium lycopersici TaxID=183478 RepID=A0A364NFS7_STELY|nr:nad(P)-binding protein [Stemphylium lycopersici]
MLPKTNTTRIFLTGATGYVGGEVLYTLVKSGFDASQITLLIRDAAKAEQVKAAYPGVGICVSDLDDVQTVKREASSVNIVLNLASTSHATSAKAIAEGLQDQARKTSSPGYWIQISGATCYAADEIASGKFGYRSDAIYDDVKDKDTILSTLRNNPKRTVENTVLSQPTYAVKTALIIGPLIYGVGRGPSHRRSIQAPEIAKSTINLKHAFKLNDGKNIWSNIHVQDLANLVHLLVSAAQQGETGMWNDDGVYNVENGKMTFEQLNTTIANEAHKQGAIRKDAAAHTETIDAAKADSLSSHAAVLWGTNARTRASKARQVLNWSPSGVSLVDTIPDLVRREAEAWKANPGN